MFLPDCLLCYHSAQETVINFSNMFNKAGYRFLLKGHQLKIVQFLLYPSILAKTSLLKYKDTWQAGKGARMSDKWQSLLEVPAP